MAYFVLYMEYCVWCIIIVYSMWGIMYEYNVVSIDVSKNIWMLQLLSQKTSRHLSGHACSKKRVIVQGIV